ncbi:swr complex subunit [Claviceps purpurea]|nr:swr complex subunit [Claviceps purpurea]KAG6143726.1 swr complex subunit [Claviceps purpurea]KAG6314873.1 swr complex subunit [Claviceps purpurea]
MASSDVRDVLNLGDSSGLRPSKKQKPTGARPSLKGLAREVLNLGGDNPIAIVPKTTQFKKRRFASRKPAAKWELLPFRNSGRDDQSLVLRHWRRKDLKDGEGAAGTGDQGQPQPPGPGELEDSIFAKFNVKIEVPQYTDDQYAMSLQNEDWTREETDYLMDMASQFDLRWTVIWDRYDWTPSATNGEMDVDGDESKAVVPTSRSRSLEDLKARYYEVAAKMMVIQKPLQYMTQQEYALHELMTHFNPKQEKVRKEFAVNTLSRSKEEAREEESLLLEIKRILARSERFNEERRELYNRLDYPRAETDISSFKSSAGLQTLLQTLMNVDKSKKRKSIMGTEGANTPSAGGGVAAATASAAAAAGAIASGASAGTQNRSSTGPETSRRDSAGASAAATRDSTTAASTPTTAGKKGQQQNQHHQQQQHLQQQQLQQQLQEKQQVPERRKLSSQEEAIYGVTHHDRLGSGPTFRTEKINKLFTHKSNQQQLRINNTLNELDVPAKLAMPTAATTAQYEQLLAAVNSLLDARKVSDKLDGEIKIEQAKKAEREKVHGATPSASGLGVDKKMSAQDEEVERDEDDDDDEEEEEDGDEDEEEEEDEEEDEEDEEEEEEEGVEDDDDEEEEEPEPDDDEKTSTSISIPTQKKPNNSGNDSENHGHGTASSVTVAQSGNKKGDSQAENTQDARKGRAHGQGQKGEEGGQTLSRSTSSAFKRSASVLSSGSDVTVKKLKK